LASATRRLRPSGEAGGVRLRRNLRLTDPSAAGSAVNSRSLAAM